METIYRAEDGAEFDDAEKCKEYDNLPCVYILKDYNRMIKKVFVDGKAAQSYIDTNNKKAPFYSYLTIERKVVDVSTLQETVHSKVTNAVEKTPWWSKFFGRGKG